MARPDPDAPTEAAPTEAALTEAVLARYPRTYAGELGIRRIDTPSGSFRLLVMAMLMAARIQADLACRAARALSRQRWNTPRSMAAASWSERAQVLNRAGYARFDERTSTMLGDTSALLLDRYRGDLRRLRREADGDPRALRRLLKECKGIGDVGVDIFFRTAQRDWEELHPFADDRSLAVARRLGLGASAEDLAGLAGRRLPELVEGLTHLDLDHAVDELRAGAEAGA